MKKISRLSSLSMILILLISCDKNDSQINDTVTTNEKTVPSNPIYYSTSEKEYAQASPFTRRLINQVDAAVISLNLLTKEPSVIKYEVIISIDKNPENKFSNFVSIVPFDNSLNSFVLKPDGKCHICGMGGAYSCIKEVETYMDQRNLDEIDIHVRRSSDGCIDITYK
ncbi:MAG: hypothetical protein RLY98_1485 [Bacteroidota bacterium]|jgi:hypothetical protein